jgi:two-component system chemotaxis response regulator CheB
MKHRVLIIDDSVIMRVVLRNYISTLPDFEVAHYPQNSKKILEFLTGYPNISIIILDIEMLENDGFDFLSRIKRKSASKIIVFSSLFDINRLDAKQNITKATQLGADAILSKPSGKVCLDFASLCGEVFTNLIRQLIYNQHYEYH